MGSLFLARDQSLGDSLCVVKQLLDQPGEEADECKRRFEAEMLALVRLKHPRIPRVRDYFQNVLGFFLVMDYVEGVSLEDEGLRPDPHQIVADAIDVLEVLEYLHQQQPPILHRDIKPANLIREKSSGRVVVVDFGLAREWSASSRHSSVGTLGYSSLEQIQGQTQPASDLYSLGVTLVQRLTGKAPQFAQPPEVPQELDPGLREIIHQAVCPDLNLRYSSATAMLADLKKWQSPPSGPVIANPSSPPVRPVQAPSNRSWWLVAALAGLALGVLLLLFNPGWVKRTFSSGADPGLAGNIFNFRKVDNDYAITLGEDISLLNILPWQKQNALERAREVSHRLNQLYHEQCLIPSCGQFKLEPEGILAGHYRTAGVDETVVFYAHRHGQQMQGKPYLIATADQALAKRMNSSPARVAAFWRDTLRAVVDVSRGNSSGQTVLSKELAKPIDKARQAARAGQAHNNLSEILRQLESAEALRLQSLLLRVPDDYTYVGDAFQSTAGYEPLSH